MSVIFSRLWLHSPHDRSWHITTLFTLIRVTDEPSITLQSKLGEGNSLVGVINWRADSSYMQYQESMYRCCPDSGHRVSTNSRVMTWRNRPGAASFRSWTAVYARLFIGRYPNINEGQIVITQPRPFTAINGAEICTQSISAYRPELECRFLSLRITENCQSLPICLKKTQWSPSN